MIAEILESEFKHNNGTVVNDIYFDYTVTDMYVFKTTFILDITVPSRTKKA